MMALALLLLLMANHLVLIDETVSLAAGEVKGLSLALNQSPAVLDVRYETLGDDAEVTVGLIGPGDGVASPRGTPGRYLRLTAPAAAGAFRFPAAELGEYQIVLDNRGEGAGPVDIRLTVTLGFGETGTLRPGLISTQRRTVVMTLSTLFFLAVVFYSGTRLVRAFKRRMPSEPPPLY